MPRKIQAHSSSPGSPATNLQVSQLVDHGKYSARENRDSLSYLVAYFKVCFVAYFEVFSIAAEVPGTISRA